MTRTHNPDRPVSDDAEFELHVNGEMQAGMSGPREEALRELIRYIAQYSADGNVAIFEVTRRLLTTEAIDKELRK